MSYFTPFALNPVAIYDYDSGAVVARHYEDGQLREAKILLEDIF